MTLTDEENGLLYEAMHKPCGEGPRMGDAEPYLREIATEGLLPSGYSNCDEWQLQQEDLKFKLEWL